VLYNSLGRNRNHYSNLEFTTFIGSQIPCINQLRNINITNKIRFNVYDEIFIHTFLNNV